MFSFQLPHGDLILWDGRSGFSIVHTGIVVEKYPLAVYIKVVYYTHVEFDNPHHPEPSEDASPLRIGRTLYFQLFIHDLRPLFPLFVLHGGTEDRRGRFKQSGQEGGRFFRMTERGA